MNEFDVCRTGVDDSDRVLSGSANSSGSISIGGNDNPNWVRVTPQIGSPWFQDFKVHGPVGERKPHACPVCQGKCQVPQSFYQVGNSSTSAGTCPVNCKSCDGKGYVVI